MVLIGNHLLKAYTLEQKIIARSSAESEIVRSSMRSVWVKRDGVVAEKDIPKSTTKGSSRTQVFG